MPILRKTSCTLTRATRACPCREDWAIVDCLMNLLMLYWATDVTDDPRHKLVAMKHADTAMTAFIRPYDASNHIVIFALYTGECEPYIKTALRILKGVDERFPRWDNSTSPLLTHCTAAWHDLPMRQMTMI